MPRMPISRFTEWFAEIQRKHYDKLLVDSILQIEELALDEEAKRYLIEQVRTFLAADCERTIAEAAALAAKGMRTDEEPLH